MSKNIFYSTSFRASVVYKRAKGFIAAGLFLAGNLVSTLPVMANPTPSANIVVDTAPPINQRPTIDVTHNGIDQINIAHPNEAGVSHNKFNQYNVHETGQILNNSPTITDTKLAGQITGNPNLKDGSSAHTIINEVTGYSPTKLLGYTEIAGKQAAVIIANPNGITCAGCGFINTSRASLATGRPNLDANGNLQSITVGGGEVGFDGTGGNFAEVPVLDIISRKVRINAPVNGQDIKVVAGRNIFNYADRTATPLAPDGSQTPEFAIETSALGGMTGNHIQMLVNEKGAGVRIDGRMASTAGDMQLTADGKLVINGELSAQNNVNAHVDVIENTGTIGANNGVNLQGRSLTNTGNIIANGGQSSNITVNDTIENSGSIETQSGLQLTAQQIHNHQSASIHAQTDLSLTSQNLTNNGKISSEAGSIQANINGTIANNNGTIAANNNITFSATGDIDNSSGQIGSNNGNITLQSGNLNNQSGLIQSNTGSLQLTLNNLNNNSGSIVTKNAPITINALQYILNNNGQIGSQQSGNINLTTQNDLQNSNGKISTGSGNISIQSNQLINSSGTILAGINNNIGDMTLRSGDIENSGGVIQATSGLVDARIGNYTDTNGGLIYAGKNLQLNASGDISIANAIQGEQGLSLTARSLTLSNLQASLSSLSGSGTVALINVLMNAGNIFVNQGGLAITAGSISNSGQINTNASALAITATNGDISNHSGRILTKNDAITLQATGNINNSSGEIGSQNNGNVILQSGNFNNQNGLISTNIGDVSLTVGSLDNSAKGIILTTQGNMWVHASQGINNSSGQFGTKISGNITITATGDISNNSGSFITPVGSVTITGNGLDNSLGKIGSNNGDVEIQSGHLANNSGIILAGSDSNLGDLTLNSGDIENSGGTIQATSGSVNATMGSYTDTDKGVIYAGKNLQINATGNISVANAIQSQGQFTLQANSLNIANKEASISSLNGNGSLTIVNDLINNGALSFSKGSLALDIGSFTNNGSFDVGFGGLNFNVKGDFSNKNGSLIADASDVTITAKGKVDNTNGQIGVKNKGNVTINSQDLLNQGGLIRTGDGDVLLTVANLNNQQGSILTNNGQINIQALQDITNNGGKIGIQNSGNITITAQGDIYNTNIGDKQGQIVTPSGFVEITGNNLDNSNGQIGALNDGAITIAMQRNVINTDGKIITPLGTIQINSGSFKNTNGQLITSSGDMILHSGDIENSYGRIEATSGLIDAIIANYTETGSYTDTNQAVLYAGKSLQIDASGDMSVDGAIQSQDQFSLKANRLNLNKVGASLSSLSGSGTVALINELVNVGNIFVNQGGLAITAGSISNRGQINTNAGALSITANNGGISNRLGRILTKNDAIALKATGNLDNSSQGQIGSQNNGAIVLQTGDLNNQNGLIRTGVGDVFLTVGSLDNRAKGIILTTSGNVEINASQGINNNSGQIGTQRNGNVTITANGDINNNQGQLITPSGLLKITGNSLDNSNLGQTGSNNGNVDIQSGRLINNFGTIIAGTDKNTGDLTLTSGDVENSNGTIQSTNGSINAKIGNYTDTNQGIVYAGKDLSLNASGDVSITNAIQSQGKFTLQANNLTLVNKDASISSLNGNGSLTIINGLINNGSIYTSLGSLEITAASLENSGSLYGQSFVHLNVGQSLNNQGVITDNKLAGGMIQSDGDVTLSASALQNTGFIQSLKGINLQISGELQNQSLGEDSGILQSGNGKDIQINAQNLQNSNGQILSDADLNLTIQNTLTNGGYLQASKAVSLTTPIFNNNAGSILALGGDLNIGLSQPTAVDNSNGKIQSNGNITIDGSSYQSSELSFLTAQRQLQANFTGNVANNGQMVAGSDFNLTGDSLSNGTQGLIYSGNGNINVTALGQNGLSNAGNIQAVGDHGQLLINTSTLTNQGVILSKNGAVLNASQQLNNQRNQGVFGRIITHGGDLTITAPTINNDGLMISPQNLTLATQTLTNTGYVSADNFLTVNTSNSIANSAAASGLNFNGTMLVSGSLIGGTTQLSAQTIQNQNGWIQGNNGLILTANMIKNSQKGIILSTNGDVTLQGAGSTEGNILPVASVVNNNSNIQAYNRLWVATQNLDNTNGVLSSDNGNIRLDQGSSRAALQSFSNVGGTLQSSKDLTLSFSQLTSAEGSKILAGGLLSLTIGSNFTNNGTLWGGQGLNLMLSSLINNAGSIIGADNGNVTIHAQDGNVTNYGVIKNLDNTGNLIIQTQNLMNDKGSILSNSNIDLQLSQKLTNQNGGEITAYNQGNLNFTGSGFDSAGLMLAGGNITGNVSGDINNSANGYIYGAKGINLTSNTHITNNAQGQIGTDTGNLSLTAPILTFNQGGQIITSNGNMVLTASSGMSNHGWLQGMGDIQMNTSSLDNSNGTIVSMNGAMTIQRDQNGNGLDQVINNNGVIQSGDNLTLYTNNLQNQSGKVLSFAALGNGTVGNISLYANAQRQALTGLNLAGGGIIQSSKDIGLAASSAGLSATGQIIANQNLTADLNGDLTNNSLLFSSLGNNQSGASITIHGNYTTSEDGGITSAGDLTVNADNITNNGVLLALNNMTVNTGSLTNNKTGLLSSTNNMNITARGNIDNNQGVIQTDQGSMVINATGDVTNTGGLIRTQSANGDITLTANSFENKYYGTLTTEENQVVYHKVYGTAVNANGQEYAGMTNQQVVAADMDTETWGGGDLRDYFYASNVKLLKIYAPEGMYTESGQPASGYFYAFLSYGNNHNGPSLSDLSRVEVTGVGTKTTLNGTSAIISAGRDLNITTTGAITNEVSHIEAGRNMQLTAASLDNKGSVDKAVYSVSCFNTQLCRTLFPRDQSKLANPIFWFTGNPASTGGSVHQIRNSIWGGNSVNRGSNSTIVAGGNLIGQFSGQVNNTTIIQDASGSDFVTDNRPLPSGKDPTTTNGESGKNGLTGPGNSDLGSNGSDLNTVNGQDTSLPDYGGVIAPQGIDPGLHVTLPGFSGSGSTSVNDILSSLTGGQALFRPNPNVNGNNSSLNGISGGGISGGGSNTGNGNSGGSSNVSNNSTIGINGSPSVQSPNNTENVVNNNVNTITGGDISVQNPTQSNTINTSSVQSGSNYLIETRPQYTSVNQFYGSPYFIERIGLDGSYMFLGDSGFDSNYIAAQMEQATGQSFPGGTYKNASDSMKLLIDNAADEKTKLGLTAGTALTPEQQAALDEDIVWYEPVIVDGKTVLAPKLYLSPKTDVLAGAAIKGKDVSITAGSINNSGLMEGTNSIALTATNGDISNIGGTIKGGKVSLNAQNGSVINSDTVNNYLVNGGTGSYLGSQGQIIGSDTVGIKASDSITTHGGTIQSGSDLAMQAGTINIGAAQLNAGASSVTHASDGTLSFNGNQTKNYGTQIKAGGNASFQSTVGDITFSGSSVNAGGNVSMSSAGNIGLNAVTDSGLTDIKGNKSGAFNNSSFSDHNEYSTALSSNILANGNITMGAKNDINLAGSVVMADGSASLYAGHDINLGSVTNTSSSSSSHKSSGVLQKEKVAGNSTTTEEIGSLVGAGKDVTIGAGHDINLSGTVTGQHDVTLIAGNTLSTNATKDTSEDYYHKSTSGLGASFNGGMASVGYQANKRTDTSKTTTYTPSEISAGHNLTTVSGGSSSFTGTDLSAGNDLSISGSSVSFNTVHNSVDETHKSSSVFGGLKVGASSDSAAGQAAQYGQAAVDTSGKGSAASKTLNAMQGGYAVGNAIATHGTTGGGYISGTAQLGFSSSKYKSEYSQTNVVGSSATAGNSLSIVARGDNASDAHNGDLTATAADLSGKNVNLSGNNVTLQSDWDTTHSSSKGSSFGGAVGVEVGTGGLSAVVNGSGSKQHANGDSATAVNTNVSATDKVTITAPGKTTLNGATVTGNQITVDTGNLDITSPQDSSHYNSTTTQAGLNVKAGSDWGAGGNYGNQSIKDDYQSTGNQLSGIYAGDGGLNVHVDDTTHLKSGVISSTADASKNHFDTGKLIAESQENHSKWDATSTGGGFSVGSGMMGSTLGMLGVLGGNLAQNSGLISGGQRKQDDKSTSQSAISDTVKVNAGSVEGSYTNDVASADGHMDNNFNANKLSNYLQNSQLGMQLVGEIMGQISDALDKNGVNGFDETNVTNDWGRIILEAAGTAAVAGTTGGNVGAAAGSAIAGNVATASTYDSVKQWAIANSNGDPQLAKVLTNAIENIIAGTIGAGAGGAIGGGSGAFNGLGISSDLQQYNQAASERAEEFRPEERDENGRLIDPLQEAIWKDEYYRNTEQLKELCKSCSSLTPINPTITEDMVNSSREQLELAKQGKLPEQQIYPETGEYKPESNSKEPSDLKFEDFDKKDENTRGKPIVLENGFYSVDGLKMSQSYYDRLWKGGRPAPFVQAQEILNSNPKITPDPRGEAGYLKYESSGLEMIYNPTTGQIGHIQPIRTK